MTKQEAVERRLAAILAADVAGYSRMMEVDEAGTLARLKAHLGEIVGPRIAAHRGNIVKTTGDGFLAEFASVVAAVECAVEIQRSMAERNTGEPEDRQIHFRIGINIGDIMVDAGDIFGDGVNIATRLEGLAEPGGICVHRDVRSQMRNRLSLTFDDMGEVEVKNIARPLRVYKIVLNGSAPTEAPAKLSPRWMPGKREAALGALALVLITAGVSVFWSNWNPLRDTDPLSSAASLPTDKLTIAVLPFSNMSKESEQQYFVDGLTEDLTTRLSSLSELFVIARSSVRAYAGKTTKPQEVGRDLGVRYVLDGSVRKSGDRLRISANLVEAKNARQVWAEQYDRQLTDIFTLQDEVIGHIVSALAIELTAVEQKQIARTPTANLEAYDYYLRAEQAARTGFRPQLREALQLYEKAIALDATFAEAFAADARTAAYVMRNDFDDVLPGPLARKRAYQHASKALDINPEAPLPFSVLAVMQAVDGHHEEALVSAERAVAFGPSDAEAHAALSLVLTFMGRYADAVTAIETAIRLNPNLPTRDRIVAGVAFLLNDKPERAIKELQRAQAEAPNVEDARAMLTAAYALAGRTDDARLAAAEAVRLRPNLSVESYRTLLSHFRSKQDLARILAAMREGGLPEWPYGFSSDSRNKLTADEIRHLALGRTWQGRLENGDPALTQIQPNGSFGYRTTTHIATGRAFVSDDRFCEQVEAVALGRPLCGSIYRRKNPAAQDDLDYTYVNAFKVFHFSPVE